MVAGGWHRPIKCSCLHINGCRHHCIVSAIIIIKGNFWKKSQTFSYLHKVMFLKQMFAELDEKMPCLRRQDGKTILYYFLHVVPLSYPCCTPGCGLGCTLVVPLVVALVVFDTTGCRHDVVSPWKKGSLFVPCCTLFCPLGCTVPLVVSLVVPLE